MLETETERPQGARVYSTRRRVRLSDMDAAGRVRLDAVARFLQDAAIDDVEETGWGIPEHIWVIRKIRVDVVAPLLRDRSVEIETWCSGVAAIAAGRRWSVRGDAGGHVEIDSVWIHLGPDQRPARIGDFGPYGLGRRRPRRSRRSSRCPIPPPTPGACRGRSARPISTRTVMSTTRSTGRRSRTGALGRASIRPRPTVPSSTTATRSTSTIASSWRRSPRTAKAVASRSSPAAASGPSPRFGPLGS